jgi:hypothetical protein
LYFQRPGDWTEAPEKAEDFGDSISAAHFAKERGLQAEVFLDFGDPEYNVLLPLQTRSPDPDQPAF